MHFIFPLFIIYFFFKEEFLKLSIILLSCNIIDLDHLLAYPIFDPNRCSIGFHPLHSYYAIGLYLLFLVPKKTRIIAIGLLWHILVDVADCFLMKII